MHRKLVKKLRGLLDNWLIKQIFLVIFKKTTVICNFEQIVRDTCFLWFGVLGGFLRFHYAFYLSCCFWFCFLVYFDFLFYQSTSFIVLKSYFLLVSLCESVSCHDFVSSSFVPSFPLSQFTGLVSGCSHSLSETFCEPVLRWNLSVCCVFQVLTSVIKAYFVTLACFVSRILICF